MVFNEGERVQYAYQTEGVAHHDDYHGVIEEVMIQYKVRWDSGEVDVHDPDDLEYETEV